MAVSALEELENLKMQESEVDKQLLNLDDTRIERHHLALIHEYNDLKDAAQAVMGLLADIGATTVTEIHKKFGIEPKDGGN